MHSSPDGRDGDNSVSFRFAYTRGVRMRGMDLSQHSAAQSTAPAKGTRAKPSTVINIAAMVVAGFVAGFISLFFLADSLAALGIPDPGRLTTFGLPFFRGAAWILMALAVGSFMVSAFLIPPDVPDKDNERLIEAPLTVDGHLAARTGALAALGVALVALVEVPLVLSDLTGTPFFQTFSPDMMSIALGQIPTAQVWLLTAGIALLVGIMGLVSKHWRMQPILFVLAVAQVIPLGMEGHSAAGGDHDYGTNSFLWHLVLIVLWVGGLLGLIAHGRRLGPNMQTAVRRYSNVALFAIIGLAISGLINAAIRIEFGDWFTTRYGLIIVTKTALTIALALFGFAHRQITMPQLKNKPQLFIRVAIVEVLVMAATVGVAGTMGRTPPPPPRDPNLNSMQILMGYELLEAPTMTNIWTMFRFDIMFGTIALLLAGFYLYALYRLKQRGLTWSVGRTVWFMLGSLTLFVVMSTGIGLYIPALYSYHMLGHMILSMVVPLFWVLGAPLTLILEAFEPGEPGKPTLHDWVEALTKSKLLRFVTNPIVNLLQFLFFFYVIYLFADLYNFAISEHAGHLIMNFAFLISGYMYFWEVIGPDPLPNRRPTPIRLLVLFISMPIHLFAGVYLMQLQTILGLEFYQSLQLPWEPDLRIDQRVGGGIAWGFGQFPLVIVFAKLFIDWLRDDRADAVRYDAKADIDDDAELEEYNRMLQQMRGGDDSSFRQH